MRSERARPRFSPMRFIASFAGLFAVLVLVLPAHP
jgi:hypothetical protein